jgi:large subunit ribosomal protein L24e
MPPCNFCGKEYDIPNGTTEVDVTGTVRHFCSSKCRKNFRLGRDSKKLKWTVAYAVSRKKQQEKEAKLKKPEDKEKA